MGTDISKTHFSLQYIGIDFFWISSYKWNTDSVKLRQDRKERTSKKLLKLENVYQMYGIDEFPTFWWSALVVYLVGYGNPRHKLLYQLP